MASNSADIPMEALNLTQNPVEIDNPNPNKIIP